MATSEMNPPEDPLLHVLEKLVAALSQYAGAPTPGVALHPVRSLCWELQDMSSCPAELRKAAEDWGVQWEALREGMHEGHALVTAVAWLWARGSTDDHRKEVEQAVQHLQKDAQDLLRVSTALAGCIEQAAAHAAALAYDAATRSRFVAVRSVCASLKFTVACRVCS